MLVLETSSRVAQEQQLETRVHARSISCAGYSVAPTKRATCIQPSLVVLSFFISTRWCLHILVALLLAVWRKQSVALETREKATERNRDDRFEEREDDGTSRQGESYWFFRTSDRTRTRWRKRMDRKSLKKDSEK